MAETDDLTQRLERAERSLAAHDFLLRGLLTHLALTSPDGFRGLIAGFRNSERYRSGGASGALTREVASQLDAMFQEIWSSPRD